MKNNNWKIATFTLLAIVLVLSINIYDNNINYNLPDGTKISKSSLNYLTKDNGYTILNSLENSNRWLIYKLGVDN
jgi:hypothetical protein